MAFDIGNWNNDGPLSGASGALSRIRTIMEDTLEQPAVAPDWISKASNGDYVKCIVQGIWEEIEANATVTGSAGGDALVGTAIE